MLPAMRGVVLEDDWRRRRDRSCGIRVDRPDAERRPETARRHHRHALEPDEMRGSDEHDDIESPIAQQAVRVRGHGARIHQARMRGDERDDVAGDVSRRARKISVDRRGEGVRVCRIPASGDRGAPDGCHPYIVEFVMPAAFTRADVAAVAALANLELEPSELDLFARQLGDILAYAEQVQQVDTTGVAATAYVV